MQIHVGTSGYGYKEWKGIFYPEKIAPGEMLHFYAGHFGTVEINYTFYHMPTVGGLYAWAEQVPPDFVFAFKAPQVITHFKQLHNVTEETKYFFRTLALLEKRLGPVLFQFPGSFRLNRPLLEAFLDLLPASRSCAFEFRSKSWFRTEIYDLLRERGCALCIADTDEKPAGEFVDTAPWGYLRLRRSAYTEAELAQWLEKIRARNWERAFVFFKHEDEARGTEAALRFLELAAATAGDVAAQAGR